MDFLLADAELIKYWIFTMDQWVQVPIAVFTAIASIVAWIYMHKQNKILVKQNDIAEKQAQIALQQYEIMIKQNEIIKEQSTIFIEQNKIFNKQTEISNNQSDIALFDHQWTVFLKTSEMIAFILRGSEIDDTMANEMMFESIKCMCLFPDSVKVITQEVFQRINRLSVVDMQIKQTHPPLSKDEKDALAKERLGIEKWFEGNAGTIGDAFINNMKAGNIKNNQEANAALLMQLKLLKGGRTAKGGR